MLFDLHPSNLIYHNSVLIELYLLAVCIVGSFLTKLKVVLTSKKTKESQVQLSHAQWCLKIGISNRVQIEFKLSREKSFNKCDFFLYTYMQYIKCCKIKLGFKIAKNPLSTCMKYSNVQNCHVGKNKSMHKNWVEYDRNFLRNSCSFI